MHARLAIPIFIAALTAAPASAQVYARVPVAELEPADELPRIAPFDAAEPGDVRAARPRVVLDGPGEAFLELPHAELQADWHAQDLRRAVLWLHLPEPRPVRGRLYAPERDARSMQRVEFTLDAPRFDPSLRERFLDVEFAHWRALSDAGAPGTAWFRHRAEAARRALGREPSRPSDEPRPVERDELLATFELFSGQRAVAENLRLDRELFAPEGGEGEIEIDSIEGVATRAYDWSKEIEGLAPELDPLARWIPEDQHALFLPRLAALIELVDELEAHGGELWTIAEPRAESSGLRAFYERQLCLPLDARARALGGLAIRSVAVTGSDPYLRSGSDVCVLLETDAQAFVTAFVRAEQERNAAGTGLALERGTSLSGWRVDVARSPDRELCSYLAVLDERTVAVTNSPAQLERLAAVRDGGAALAAVPEYTFFRARYLRGAADERALFVLTDAAIRRWAGPRLRIAASRRTRAAAWLADAQCAALGGKDIPPTLPDGSPSIVEEGRVRSPHWGSARWSTPLVELELARASAAEAQAYERFRERYERGWRDVFDPIALRLARQGRSWEADLTVRPLIAQTEYSWLSVLAGDARLAPGSADAHAGTLAHLALAVDFNADPISGLADLLRGASFNTTVELFGWMAGGVGLYIEPDDALFADWAAAHAADEGDLWLEEHWMHLPVAIHVDSRDPLRLALWVNTLRAFTDGGSPGLLRWETREVGEQRFVTIHASVLDRGHPETRPRIHYATLPDAWIVSLREDVLLAAIERRATAREAEPLPWLGESAALHLDRAAFELARALGDHEAQTRARATAYGPIPLLDDWRARFPERDPAELYREAFGLALVDPSGADYVWDAEWETHASPAFGHPARPRQGPAWPSLFEGLEAVDLGLTFEADGLRARARLVR
ncbi:MAG TPA: hypothetical protein VMT18_16410 [Planctomycetota bacterium]|nr:hypothetical protein [Planctomycetota bacterium]